jgi:O-antigen/teichoic acid export membrane protein
VAETRHLSGWFTATALVGQVQVQAVGFIVAGQLSRADLSGLRGGQTALIQPVQNFVTAVQGLLVPRASRLARDAAAPPGRDAAAPPGRDAAAPPGRDAAAPPAGEDDAAAADRDAGAAGPAAGAELRRLIRLLALAFTGLAALLVAVMWPLATLVLTHVRKFSDIAPLALPMSLQAAIYLVQVPFTSALRAMHRARLLFVQYVTFTAVSLTALVVGAHARGLAGAAWGLTVGAAVGLAMMIGLYRSSLHWLGRDESDRYTDEGSTRALPPTGDTVASTLP